MHDPDQITITPLLVFDVGSATTRGLIDLLSAPQSDLRALVSQSVAAGTSLDHPQHFRLGRGNASRATDTGPRHRLTCPLTMDRPDASTCGPTHKPHLRNAPVAQARPRRPRVSSRLPEDL